MTIDQELTKSVVPLIPEDALLAHAVLDVQMAVADIMLSIVTAKSSDELMRINRETERLVEILQAVASSALDRAERL